ncbi:hypothetical protein [Burkholderia ubonensis]|uniref:hypothetical protein n=1 Tax=Burkholderia ubonensis TaxID=101571 RepID=UPI00138FA96B|nr:hypothetical protein [Burkholderia ubonensis]
MDSKVTSHIRRKATAGDIFLTGCDYAEKPLERANAFPGGVLGQIPADGGLSRCVAGAGLADAALPATSRVIDDVFQPALEKFPAVLDVICDFSIVFGKYRIRIGNSRQSSCDPASQEQQ